MAARTPFSKPCHLRTELISPLPLLLWRSGLGRGGPFLPRALRHDYSDLENMASVTPAIALGATDENVAKKLHLDFLKTSAAAALALTLARIETECAGAEPALTRGLGLGEKFPDIIEGPDINRRIGTWRFAQNGLIDQHHLAEAFPTCEDW